MVFMLDGSNRCRERLESTADSGKQSRSCIGQGQRAGSAAEQSASAIVLQQPDLMADGGGCDAQLLGGFLEAEMPRSGVERAQRDQGWQLLHAHQCR